MKTHAKMLILILIVATVVVSTGISPPWVRQDR
jgi:hypothetical protein